MKKFFITISTILLISCSSDDSPRNIDLIGKTFDHLFFETLQECRDAQPDPNFFINCHQELNFIDARKVRIVITDIINQANYNIIGNTVIIKASQATEFSNDLVFEIINDTEIKLKLNNTIWKLRKEDSPWD